MDTGDRRDHLAAHPQLAQTERRRAEIDDNLRALCGETAYKLPIVERARQVVLGPDIFANRHTNPATGDGEDFATLAGLEVTIFIKHIVGRQQRLEALAHRLAALEQGGGIEKWLPASFVSIDVTDEERNGSDAAVQALDYLQILRHETRFENEVLRRVTGRGEFGSEHQLRPARRESLVGAEDFVKIAAQIADDGIDLRDADPHAPCRVTAGLPRATAFRISSMGENRGLVSLVAGVERVVGTFDKDLGPLDEAGGEKAGNHANQDFLDEGRTH